MSTIKCRGCTRTLVHARQWREIPLEQREAMRDTHAKYTSRELCQACYRREWRRDQVMDHPRRTRSVYDVAEDWRDLAGAREGMSQNTALQLLAPRMGMNPASLERAVLRAKRLGLLERQVAA